MSALVFVDTNVFVCRHDSGDPARQARADEWIAHDLRILERAWHIQDGHSVSWWDAVIVAAAQSLGCSILLTEDQQHGHAFGEVRVVDPFRSGEVGVGEIVGGCT